MREMGESRAHESCWQKENCSGHPHFGNENAGHTVAEPSAEKPVKFIGLCGSQDTYDARQGGEAEQVGKLRPLANALVNGCAKRGSKEKDSQHRRVSINSAFEDLCQ